MRDLSVDVARGVAIVAIVLGHVERGLASALLLPHDPAMALDRTLYLFHLATFAYLSGLFVQRAVEGEGAWRMVSRRTTLFVWLYLLWTAIQGTVRVAASSVANTAVGVGDIARIWIPEGQLWFLPWLVAVTTVAAVTQPWRSFARGAAVLTLAGLLAVATWGYDPRYAFTRGWALLLPFLIGCVVTQLGHARAVRRLCWVAMAAVLGVVAWLLIGIGTDATTPTTGGADRTIESVTLGVTGCVAGAGGTLAVAALLARSPLAAVVALIGRRSLEIFLAHIVVASGTRIVLEQVGVTDAGVHVAVGTTLGVVAPLVVAVTAERAGATWLFSLPLVLRRSRG